MACGPDYTYWYDLNPNLAYDPIAPQSSDSGVLFGYFIGGQIEPVDYRLSKKTELKTLYSRINTALNQHGRNFLVSHKGQTYFEQPDKNKPIDLFEVDLLGNLFFWGSCQSNSAESLMGFINAAIKQTSLDDSLVRKLIKHRQDLRSSCGNTQALNQYLQSLASYDDPFHSYLKAAASFYKDEHQNAQAIFENLQAHENAWLAETSSYMLARNKMVESGKDWNEWESKEQKIDSKKALQSAELFKGYLQQYPNGQYARSAKGLTRRAYWLAQLNDQYRDELLNFNRLEVIEYSKVEKGTQQQITQLKNNFTEINHYLPRTGQRANLQGISDFVGEQPFQTKTSTAKTLNRLITFLEMEFNFQQGKYQTVIDYYQPLENILTPEKLLVIRSLEKVGNQSTTLTLWKELIETEPFDQAALTYQLTKTILALEGIKGLMLNKDIKDVNLKRVHLASLCDDSEQLEVLKEDLSINNRHAVLADLSTRYIFKSKFTELHKLFENNSDDSLQEFSSIRTAVKQIANNESLGKAYMNIAFFLKTKVNNPLDSISRHIETQKQKNSPNECHTNTLSDGAKGPYFYFNKSLSYFDDKKSLAEEKALYYMSQCRKIGIQSRSCMWGELDENMLSAKQAFARLHKKYKNGKWAKKAKFYYER